MIVTFDIETIPVQDQSTIDLISKGIKAPGNIKLADSIAKWELENKQTAIDEAVAKTSFDGAYGQICCIGWCIDDGEIQSRIGGEKEIIESFFSHLNTSNPRELDCTFVGHNVSAFDLRFLFQRAIILGVKPPAFIPMNTKSWDNRVFDTMTYFAGYGERISLDKLSKALGLEGKAGVTGADVWPMYKAGKTKEIAEYCKHDVELTRNVYKKLTFTYVE